MGGVKSGFILTHESRLRMFTTCQNYRAKYKRIVSSPVHLVLLPLFWFSYFIESYCFWYFLCKKWKKKRKRWEKDSEVVVYKFRLFFSVLVSVWNYLVALIFDVFVFTVVSVISSLWSNMVLKVWSCKVAQLSCQSCFVNRVLH